MRNLNTRRRRNNLMFDLERKDSVFDGLRLNAFYLKNLLKSKLFKSCSAFNQELIVCMQELLDYANFKLEDVLYEIVDENFKVLGVEQKGTKCLCVDATEEEDFDAFASEKKGFTWNAFIRKNKRQLKGNGGDFEALIFSALCKKVVAILDKSFKLKTFKPITQRALELQDFLELNDAEIKLVLFSLAIGNVPSIMSFLERFTAGSFETVAAVGIGITKEEYLDASSLDSNLKRRRICLEDNSNILAVHKVFAEFLYGNSKSFVYNLVKEEPTQNAFDISSFDLADVSKKLIIELLKSDDDCKILLYGKAGSGKTEFARALAKYLDREIVIPKKPNPREMDSKLGRVNLCSNVADRLGKIALIDECDSIISSISDGGFRRTGDKGEINLCLDNMEGKSIWITNSVELVDSSTKRRFAYSLEFDGLSKIQKKTSLESALKNTKLASILDAEKVYKIVDKYSLSTAGISLAINNAAKLLEDESEGEIMQLIEDVAARQSSLFSGGSNAKEERYKQDMHFDSDIINMDLGYDRLISSLQNYTKKLEANEVSCPMNLIFAGVAGSGKTELAKHIAHTLEKRIIIKNISDLKSKYVGETEQNIAKAFSQAERENAILVIDEADSLFVDRTSVMHSWEVSQTNEILAQMENYRGIFICSTNLLENIDSAAMRRFQRKINFNYLKEEARQKLFKSYFLEGEETLDESTIEELNYLDVLTAGDFKNIYQQVQFEEVRPTQYEFVEMLKREMSFKKVSKTSNSSIGFA